jgi:lipoate-protein ligase A
MTNLSREHAGALQDGVRDGRLDPVSQLLRERTLFQAVESGVCDLVWRCWQPSRPLVVIGCNGCSDAEVYEQSCREDGIEVLRRFTGGGAVVLAPGCLAYTLVLPTCSHPQFEDVAASFRLILGRIVEALELPGLSIIGSDLVLDGRKVSGNAQRRGRRAFIQHGTLLFDFDARCAARWLKEPVRQPAYRMYRSHEAFLGNLPLTAGMIERRLLRCSW